MIELKITNTAALLLLSERMKIEFENRKLFNSIPDYVNIDELSYKELLDISECAAFDLICLLPADIFDDENNLHKIITKAIRSLSGIYNKEEFNVYSERRAEKLVDLIYSSIKIYGKKEILPYN
jgi:hypothetical protein